MATFHDFDIRTMSRAEMDLSVEWAAEEGWNPGLHDAEVFYATDPNGYFMAFHRGEPIGSISAVAYDQAFGFIGFFIVKLEYRGGRAIPGPDHFVLSDVTCANYKYFMNRLRDVILPTNPGS